MSVTNNCLSNAIIHSSSSESLVFARNPVPCLSGPESPGEAFAILQASVMSWTTASQLKPSTQRHPVDRACVVFPHYKVLKIEPHCENLARINVWVPGEVHHAEERQLGARFSFDHCHSVALHCHAICMIGNAQ